MKGAQVHQYWIGQFVEYKFKKNPDLSMRTGIILKLHKSGRQGVAEIRPSDGTHKISRKLQHVSSME